MATCQRANELEQNYSYDRLNRTTQWTTDPNIGNESYTYDKIGNRISFVKGGITYNFTYQTDNNQLKNIIWSTDTISYNINQNGALSTRTETKNTTLVDKEEYEYFASGMQSKFIMKINLE